MASKSLIYGIVALAIFNYVIAEESAQRAGWQFPSVGGSGSFSYGSIDFPNFGSPGSSSGNNGFNIPGLSGLSGLFGRTSTSTAAPESTTEGHQTRKRRETGDHDESDHHELQSRLFFSRFPIITSCNYTAQAGNTCLSDRQALRCLPNNVGLLTNCAGLFRYCNNGRCSLFQATTSTSSTSSTSSSSSSSSSTSTSTTTTSTTVSG